MPVVTTGDATSIARDSAVIADNAFSGFDGAIKFVAVQYAPRSGMAAPMTAYGVIGSPFTVALTGLVPGTTYDYRAVVCTCEGCCFGEFKSFVTLQPLPIPVVTTGNATNIVADAATIIDNAYSGIPGTLDFVGVQYATDPGMAGAALAQGAIGSPFTVNLTGLQPGTTYYYRAAVGTPTGTYYGQIKSFVTPASAAVVSTGDATNIYANGATILGNTFTGIYATISLVGVQYSSSPTMTSAMTVSGAIGSPFTVNLTGLQPNTTYYFRAVVNASTGTYFGEIKSFTTPNRT